MMLVQILLENNISLGQYGNDHLSRLERVKDDQLIYFLNHYHQEYSIQFSKKIKQIPVVLQKQKEDCSRIDLILLGYLEIPIDDSDQDALLQKVLDEIQGQSQEKLQIYKHITLSVYKEE